MINVSDDKSNKFTLTTLIRSSKTDDKFENFDILSINEM
jgi:hypothetical protein